MKAVLFDMDGVLINSEIFYMEGTLEWMRELGFNGTFEDVCAIIGTTMQRSYEMIVVMLENKYTLEEVEAKNEQYFSENPLDYRNIMKPNVIELLEDCRLKNLKMAICSSSSAGTIEEVVEKCGFNSYFDYTVSGEQFTMSKPHPEIYLHAADVLGVKPHECMVVEDSMYGIQAGVSAGMRVIALCDSRFQIDQSKANTIVSDLSEIKLLVENYA